MIEIEQAYALLEQTFKALPSKAAAMELAVEDSLGHFLAQPVSARYDSPPFNQSAMDGIAFQHDPQRQSYKVVGTVAAGDSPNGVKPGPGECVRIMTGAPVPDSADTVEMVEQVKFSEDEAHLQASPNRGQHIRKRGENLASGGLFYQAGVKITPSVLAGLYSQGVRFVTVRQPLRVGIAATGDELVGQYRTLNPGQIHNSNGPGLRALLESPSVQILDLGVLPDALEPTRQCLAANTDLDLIILSGGVSMGDFDMAPGAARDAGFKQVFHKIRMKPGKPLWFGVHEKGACMFGLPGNPVSVTIGAMLFVQPMLRALLCGAFKRPAMARAVLAQPVENKGRLTLFKGLRLVEDAGQMRMAPIETAGSGDLARFSLFEALGRLGPGEKLNSGDEIQILLPFLG